MNNSYGVITRSRTRLEQAAPAPASPTDMDQDPDIIVGQGSVWPRARSQIIITHSGDPQFAERTAEDGESLAIADMEEDAKTSLPEVSVPDQLGRISLQAQELINAKRLDEAFNLLDPIINNYHQEHYYVVEMALAIRKAALQLDNGSARRFAISCGDQAASLRDDPDLHGLLSLCEGVRLMNRRRIEEAKQSLTQFGVAFPKAPAYLFLMGELLFVTPKKRHEAFDFYRDYLLLTEKGRECLAVAFASIISEIITDLSEKQS